MKRWATLGFFVFALHFGWEMTQGKWFASMQGLPFWHATLFCLRATLGDVVITAVAFVIAAALLKDATWPVGRRVMIASTVFIVVGVAMTVAYEHFALSSGRWRYDERMPTLFGLGVLPLLQWLFLPAVEILLFRLRWRHE